ncbi:hypothetical protein ACWIE6_12690 [Paenibacillus taichungensis]
MDVCPQYYPICTTAISHTWAPEWFKDSNGSLNIIVSISPGNYENFKPYVITATNATLSSTTWSLPQSLQALHPTTSIPSSSRPIHHRWCLDHSMGRQWRGQSAMEPG